MRMLEVPATAGYGDPIVKFFRLADQVKIVGAATCDERFTPADGKDGPYVLVVTAQGQVLRTPLEPFRTASTKVGRRYVRLGEGDKVVTACVVTDEPSLMLASAGGRVLHFGMDEVNVLSGAGKGVIGIKLDGKDVCLGAAVLGPGRPPLVVERNDGETMEFTKRYELVGRGGKGFEAVKRKSFVRVVPPPIVLTDWDAMEKKDVERNGKHEGQATLFGEGGR
jgi:DNA gyrase subunit A